MDVANIEGYVQQADLASFPGLTCFFFCSSVLYYCECKHKVKWGIKTCINWNEVTADCSFSIYSIAASFPAAVDRDKKLGGDEATLHTGPTHIG